MEDIKKPGNRKVGRELHMLHNMMSRQFTNKAKIDRITGSNGWIIAYLSHNRDRDIYQRDIEKDFCITRSTVSRVLLLMEKKGLIERTAGKSDARLKKITLTPRAIELDKLMREDNERAERTLTAGLSSQEIDTLLQLIDKMKANISQPHGD